MKQYKLKIFVVSSAYEYIRDKYYNLFSKYLALRVRERKTRNLLYSAQEIMTRLRNRQNQIYSCDCGKMNKSAIDKFFNDVVSLNDSVPCFDSKGNEVQNYGPPYSMSNPSGDPKIHEHPLGTGFAQKDKKKEKE